MIRSVKGRPAAWQVTSSPPNEGTEGDSSVPFLALHSTSEILKLIHKYLCNLEQHKQCFLALGKIPEGKSRQ